MAKSAQTDPNYHGSGVHYPPVKDVKTAIKFGEWAGPSASYHACPGGIRHWGPYGAAGVLPYGIYGGQAYVLLTLRSPHVQQGNTWSIPGGALERGESPWQAARAEANEELTGLGWMTVTGKHVAPCPYGCGWSYTTYVVRVGAEDYIPTVSITTDRRDAWETSGVAWIPVADVENIPNLHPAFAAAWPALSAKIEEQQS